MQKTRRCAVEKGSVRIHVSVEEGATMRNLCLAGIPKADIESVQFEAGEMYEPVYYDIYDLHVRLFYGDEAVAQPDAGGHLVPFSHFSRPFACPSEWLTLVLKPRPGKQVPDSVELAWSETFDNDPPAKKLRRVYRTAWISDAGDRLHGPINAEWLVVLCKPGTENEAKQRRVRINDDTKEFGKAHWLADALELDEALSTTAVSVYASLARDDARAGAETEPLDFSKAGKIFAINSRQLYL